MKKYFTLVFVLFAFLLVIAAPKADSKMVLVEKGTFMMGNVENADEGYPIEKPVHKVILTYNFLISKYETTFAEFDAFCKETKRELPSDESWGRENHPVLNVSWFDAISYCNWLSKKENIPAAYDKKGNLIDSKGKVTTDITKVIGYRLPTEAEWEYAARGGNKSKGYKYAGTNNSSELYKYINFSDVNSNLRLMDTTQNDGNARTASVGSYLPNELGLYDMNGNVWEWCTDYENTYTSKNQTNPYYYTPSANRSLRGGSWDDIPLAVRLSIRYFYGQNDISNNLGFRICRTVQ